ncbi:uncharacterized protein F4812DRAFT_454407 [Daldinia caldariorum]|uniref:uncharacterized protein n=1 Tax=Daldinia caldariorum TaxID=326644 RepID=UPI002008DC03|nr:uncharacterized protein F4812DRAFT_454407 [Daldinia caldariorum]KAI1472592.1 hypothetical protein F4812DRAFT_454407 [Daldinia caldariorum]
MISPAVRGLSYHHKKPLAGILLRAGALLNNTLVLCSTPSSSIYSQFHPQSQLSLRSSLVANPSLQSVRMVSNSRNEPFTRDKLFDLKGHVALVTGGGSGIGLMATQALVANGAKVYVTGRTKEKLDRVAELYSETGGDGKGSIVPIQCDLTDKAQLANLAQEISSREGCLCILVNNAGISGATTQTEAGSAGEMKKNLFDAEQSTMEDWTDVYRTNVAQIFFATTAFLPLLQKSSQKFPGWSGTVINISSISGLVKTAQHHFAYNASKSAAAHLTRMLAAEVAANELKIRINSIAPGVFPSEMITDGSNEDQKSHIPKEKYESKVPAGRPGKDDDMAQTVLFFAANQYLNGQIVAVDGGYTLAAGE